VTHPPKPQSNRLVYEQTSFSAEAFSKAITGKTRKVSGQNVGWMGKQLNIRSVLEKRSLWHVRGCANFEDADDALKVDP